VDFGTSNPVDSAPVAGVDTLFEFIVPKDYVASSAVLTLTLDGTWVNTTADASGVVGLAPVTLNSADDTAVGGPMLLVSTRPADYSTSGGSAATFNYTSTWQNITLVPGTPVTAYAIRNGGVFRGLSVKSTIKWSVPGALDGPSPSPSPEASPSPDVPSPSPEASPELSPSPEASPVPSPSGETSPEPVPSPEASPSPVPEVSPSPVPEDNSTAAPNTTTTVSTPGNVTLPPPAVVDTSNLEYHTLVDFVVPSKFNGAANTVNLFIQGLWFESPGAASPLGLVGVAQNGTLLAFTLPSQQLSASNTTNGSFSYGSAFANVPLVAGAPAQVWAGLRGGWFASLSASTSLSWADAAPDAIAAPNVPAPTAPVQTQPETQSTSVGTLRRVSFGAPRAANAVLRPIFNFTIPPGFNPSTSTVDMVLSGSWKPTASGASSKVPPLGGVALMKDGRVLAATFPSEYLGNGTAAAGNFYYGATWNNLGLPTSGTVEVWAGMQGGSFKDLDVSMEVRWAPSSDSVAPVLPSVEVPALPSPVPVSSPEASPSPAAPVEASPSPAAPVEASPASSPDAPTDAPADVPPVDSPAVTEAPASSPPPPAVAVNTTSAAGSNATRTAGQVTTTTTTVTAPAPSPTPRRIRSPPPPPNKCTLGLLATCGGAARKVTGCKNGTDKPCVDAPWESVCCKSGYCMRASLTGVSRWVCMRRPT
jgi:hypothetical protein